MTCLEGMPKATWRRYWKGLSENVREMECVRVRESQLTATFIVLLLMRQTISFFSGRLSFFLAAIFIIQQFKIIQPQRLQCELCAWLLSSHTTHTDVNFLNTMYFYWRDHLLHFFFCNMFHCAVAFVYTIFSRPLFWFSILSRCVAIVTVR